MRTLAALALLLVSAPTFAQSTYADSTGAYLAVHQLALNVIGQRGLDATLGYRFGNGVDVGARIGHQTLFGIRETVAGPVAGITRPVGHGWSARLEGALLATSASASQEPYANNDGTLDGGFSVGVTALTQDVTASASRPIRLVGSFRARPTLGAYAVASQILLLSGNQPAAPGRASESAGLHLELSLAFRVFGRDAAITPTWRVPVVGRMDAGEAGYGYAGGGFRLNV